MKKRFLSAALALAMVLTLLPLGVMSASAASAGDDAYYHVQGNAFANASENNSTDALSGTGWYARTRDTSVSGTKYTYEALSDGFVTSAATNNGATAKWYGASSMGTPTIDGKPVTVKPAQFTLLSDVTIAKLDWDISNVRLNNHTLTISEFADRNAKIVASGNGKASGAALSLGGAVPAGRSAVITLTDCALSGTVTLPKGTLTLTRVDASSTIAMGTSVSGGGGTVNLNENSSASAVNMCGPSTLNVNDMSNAGNVTVFGGSKADIVNNSKGTNPSWKGVTVNLKTSGRVTAISGGSSNSGIGGNNDATDTTTHTINAESNAAAGTINLTNANVTLNGAGATAATVGAGSVKLSGSASIGAITLNGSGKCTLEVGAGATVTGAVQYNGGASDLTVKVSGGTFGGTISLGSYAGHGITGGTFSNSITNAGWLGNVTYEIKRGATSTYTYTNSFDDAVSAYTDTKTVPSKKNEVSIVGTTNGSSIKFVLDNDTEASPTFELKADANTLVPLPIAIGKRGVSIWYNGGVPIPAGEKYPMGSSDVVLKATSTEADLGTINGVSAEVSGSVKSPNLDAQLVGSTIKLSGAVDMGSSSTATIKLVFTTTTSAAADADKLTVMATFYDGNPKDFRFTETSLGENLAISGAYKEVGLKGSNTRFTVDCSGLVRLQSVTVDSSVGTTAVSVSASMGNAEKAALITALQGISTPIDYTNSPAMMQALNKALASYTSSGVDSAITNGRRAYAKEHYGNTNADTMKNPDVTAYNTLTLQVYLDIQVTNIVRSGASNNGSLTLNITPKYREVVSNSRGDSVVAGTKSLDAALLKSTDGLVEIVLPSDWGIKIFNSAQLYAHHGDYVYEVKSDRFTNLHGFSTFVINAVAPVAEVDQIVRNGVVVGSITEVDNVKGPFYYDTLAAAVADVADGGTVKVAVGYKGPTSIPVSGSARQFTVNNSANAGTALTFTGANVTSDGKNDRYTVELTKDTAAGTTKLTVNTVPNGSASLSAASAVPGATVTGTIRPNTGYMAGSFTATAQTTTGSSVNVSVKVDAANNTFSFVVPNNAVSVVVTPVFVVGDGRVVIGVASAVGGSATTSAAATENKAAPGATVTVATVPNNGYRTIGLTARTNTGATVAVTRTGLNAFSMVIPTGAVTVTVTPSFDLDTGTPFADVLSSHWATKYVTWAYQTKYVEGTGTYAFSPATYITRGEVVAMLWKAENKPIVNYANPFKDVPTNYWAYDAVMWAASKGLIDTSSSYFMPTGYASRAEVVTILYKHAKSPTVYGTSGFADVPASAAYSRAVTWARQNKLTNGYGGSTYFRPNYAISRAEVATFLARAFGNIA